MTELSFLKDFKKNMAKADIDVGEADPPRYWYSTGNHVLNKIISGSFLRGIPQGRITDVSGPSGAGKSFIAVNVMREAQQQGAHLVVLDSENALDNNFVSAIGVDPDKNYTYVSVDTISQVKKVVSTFIKGYTDEYGYDDPEAPQVLFIIDSLDMLMTDAETEQFKKGENKGDMGQKNKQLKSMLRSFVQNIKRPNIAMLVTSQVYQNQNLLNGEGLWIVSGAVKFSLSQIIMVTKLKLKDKTTKAVSGIRMKVDGYKTRFAKFGQTATIEVPYETGMDQYSGLLEVAIELDVCIKKGSRYSLKGEDDTWYSKDFHKYAADVLVKCEANRDKFIEALLEDDEEDLTPQLSAKKRRKQKADSNEE